LNDDVFAIDSTNAVWEIPHFSNCLLMPLQSSSLDGALTYSGCRASHNAQQVSLTIWETVDRPTQKSKEIEVCELPVAK
jgi:hypothetical protein